ncbi:MAG TPA: RodZ domain-containing protein [Steroidobacteraceae bacterium]|nr:RodZ domain-containing protein [Steroidobacteraceae bacterium]
MTGATHGDAGCGIGARLRRAREQKGLTVLQAAERLHVDARMLEALEAEDFGALDAPVYVRGHLRRYAELLGESPAELQDLYAAGVTVPGPDLRRIPHREPYADPARLVMPALLVLGLFAVAGLVWWLFTLPAPIPQAVSLDAAAGAAAGAGGGTAEELMSAAAGAASRAAPSGAGEHAAGAARAAEAHLALRFSAVSWVEVYDASGQRLVAALNPPDSTRTLSGAPPLRVVLGNAPGVALRLNGQPVALDGLVRRDGSARFLLERSGRALPVPPLVAHGG